jgi:CheY-like chemotaxis protein
MARILIVDDEPDVLAAMNASLEDVGQTVMKAGDRRQGMIMAAEQVPELIFLDLNMPRIDGFETLASLKADDRTREIPVVIVCAKGRPEDRLRTRAMGATDYINKPWADGEFALGTSLALMYAARRQTAPWQGRAPALQQKILDTMRPPQQARVITIRQPIVRQQPAPPPPPPAATPPKFVIPVPSQSPNGQPPRAEPARAETQPKDGTRLAAARFIVQYEYSANQAAPATQADSKSAVILRPFEDPDWVVRFDAYDSPTAAAQAPGQPYRYVYGVRGVSQPSASLAILSEWELAHRAQCGRFEANRTALFEIHRRQFGGLISEWLLKRLDDSPRYTVLAMLSEEDAAVRFRAFIPPVQFTTQVAQRDIGATELFGQCACRVKRPDK